MSTHNTPTEHGNWHVINGELVDIDKNPPATPASEPELRRKSKDKPSNNEE